MKYVESDGTETYICARAELNLRSSPQRMYRCKNRCGFTTVSLKKMKRHARWRWWTDRWVTDKWNRQREGRWLTDR